MLWGIIWLTFAVSGDISDVADYLWEIDGNMILKLGAHLGLSTVKLKDNLHSGTFWEDDIAAWICEEDNVSHKGKPTWRNLTKALEHLGIGQSGVAHKIKTDKKF